MISNEQKETIAAAEAQGFKVSGTGAVRADRSIGFEGLDYVTLWNEKRQISLKVYDDGSGQFRTAKGNKPGFQFQEFEYGFEKALRS